MTRSRQAATRALLQGSGQASIAPSRKLRPPASTSSRPPIADRKTNHDDQPLLVYRAFGVVLRSLRSLRTTPEPVVQPHPCHCHVNLMWSGTFSVAIDTPTETVHPRVCGERGGDDTGSARGVGSSPRVRGTGAVLAWAAPDARFIPACAGNGTPRSRRRR